MAAIAEHLRALTSTIGRSLPRTRGEHVAVYDERYFTHLNRSNIH